MAHDVRANGGVELYHSTGSSLESGERREVLRRLFEESWLGVVSPGTTSLEILDGAAVAGRTRAPPV
ncbi:MAG: hypothetical protein ACYC1I_03465 [Acidimicrobiales bacterium]